MKFLMLAVLTFPLSGCAFFDALNAARDHRPPKVLEDVFELGMTKGEAMAAWPAKCSNINRSVGIWGADTQWVYGVGSEKAYLYFKNGILIAWQD